MPENKVVNGYEYVTYSVNQYFQLFYSEKNHRTYPTHYHNAMEITMPLKKPYGCIWENGSFLAQPQELLFVGSGVLHSVGPLTGQEGGAHYTLLVDVDWLHQFDAFHLLLNQTTSAFVLRRDMTHYADARLCFLEICRVYDTEDAYKDIVIASEFLKLITLIAREMEQARQKAEALTETKNKDFRQEILFSSHYIRDHCAEDLTLETMGRMLGISKYYYHRKFKEICHMSFHEHLANCRMKLACQYLTSSDHSVEDIARLCGYQSVPSFIRMFKQSFNMTPGQYRKTSPADTRQTP